MSQRWLPPGRVRWTPLLVSFVMLAAVVLLATGVGSVGVAPGEVVQVLWFGATGQLGEAPNSVAATIVWRIRLPRVLLAALVGGSLALSGAAFQGLFRNPLADPYLLGVASGAGFGAALTLIFAPVVPLLAMLGVPLVSFVFGLLSVVAVVLLARQGRTIPMVSLILAGVVLGSSFSAATSFVMLLDRELAANVLAWLLGSFGFASWANIAAILPFVLVAGVATLAASRALNVLQLGDEAALHLGLPVETVKFALIGVATLATAAAVSVSGIIGFVGLMVPHAVRLAFGPDHRTLIPLSALWGALFMVLADLLARTIIAPAEIPVGVITALVGGPFFLYLLRRERRGFG